MEETVGEPKLGSLESGCGTFPEANPRILREYERGVVFTLGAALHRYERAGIFPLN